MVFHKITIYRVNFFVNNHACTSCPMVIFRHHTGCEGKSRTPYHVVYRFFILRFTSETPCISQSECLSKSCVDGLKNAEDLYLKLLIQKFIIAYVSGGGINSGNLNRILDGCGAKEFHGSARAILHSKMSYRKEGITMGAALCPPEFSVKVTDKDKVLQLVHQGHTHKR